MEIQQDDSYFRQPLPLAERSGYMEPSTQYCHNFQGLDEHESIAASGRMPIDGYRNGLSALDVPFSMNPFHCNGYPDTWRYHDPSGAREHDLGTQLQLSPPQCLNQEFVSPARPTFERSYKMNESPNIDTLKEEMACSSISPHVSSPPAMEIWPLVPEEPIPAFQTEISLPLKGGQDNEEVSGDKPYARLIHEALMQAPGHRMLLRDIYDWFLRNTTKPSESGTNGWQNSIRHNLSMNQAFENDRTDPAKPGQPTRKTNSVWILTDDAVRHGVLSTTRYRKHSSNKKTSRTRSPAPLRQRSGAKGGRAARRAARLRRVEQMNRQGSESVPQFLRFSNFCGPNDNDRASQEAERLSIASPLTAGNEPSFGFPQSSDGNSYFYRLPDLYDFKPEPSPNQAETPDGVERRPKVEACITEMLTYP